MYKNILVINLMHIGDLMLTTPVLRTLRANFPKARISLLADKKLADLVIANKHIDECLLLDKKGEDNNFRNFIKFLQKIRAKRYDLVINLHRNERASCMAAFSGAKKIVGYAKPFFAFFFSEVLPNKALPGKNQTDAHQVEAHFEVLTKAVGVTKIDDGGIEMWLTKSAKKSAEKIWRENFSPKEKVIAFNIGASWETKRWIDSYFAECADELTKEGYTALFLGSGADKDIVETCVGKMKNVGDNVKILTGKLTLGELAGILSRCVLFITTDSGPMHIGVAMNVPIVTMFGASPVPGFYPYDAKDILIKTPEACHPCGIHVCPKKGDENIACMKHIPVAVVLKHAWELLAEYRAQPANKLPSHYGEYKCKVVEL